MMFGTRHYAHVGAIAEEVGFTSLHLSDHLVFPDHVPATYPYTDDGIPRIDGVELLSGDLPCYDPFVQFGFLAACTQSVQLVTTVCIAPLYHPLALARSVATVDRMSGGRIELGLGVGWLAAEFGATGAAFSNRGRRTDSIIEILRQLWTEEVIEYEDAYYRFGPIRFNPKPLNRTAIPIHVGGSSQPALKRAGRLGDGWIEIGSRNIEDFTEMLSVVNRARADAGRADLPFAITTTAMPRNTVDDYRRLADLGVSRIVAVPAIGDGATRDPASFRDWALRFRDDVMAKV
ncbi:LLM class F420-dependent oxidoreductase [Mycobacterium paraintracellulare]|uniref:TIGR03619 family F420-dependent LLM class oxidoreductase n=1 Tax=Mycobacterium paraintracellulare TaxID=1138383 RepID=UPI00192902A1|nr:TIGR03619 family F420-dependent LLM class oxidoreductase [Mycobacterium paraintracellulare]BCP07996.1 LLM class F420-dependent oxidoreductase [Mycobacterium paraintracellulare]